MRILIIVELKFDGSFSNSRIKILFLLYIGSHIFKTIFNLSEHNIL